MSGIWENNEPKPVRDISTGTLYSSRHQAGVALAAEAGIDPQTKPSPWYKVNKALPGRFYDEQTRCPIGPDGRLEQTQEGT